MDYGELTAKCKERYSNFILNGDYHANRRLYESDDKCAYIRYLDPDKKKSGKKVFYSEAMLSKLDNHYRRINRHLQNLLIYSFNFGGYVLHFLFYGITVSAEITTGSPKIFFFGFQFCS